MTNNIKSKMFLCRRLYDAANYILPEIKLKQTSATDLIKADKISQLGFVGQDMLASNMPANTILSEEENRIIGNFFYSLGKYDVSNQVEQIEYFKQYIKKSEQNYLEIYKSKSKIYISMCMSFGIIISILLV